MYWQIQAIFEELFNLAKEQYNQRPRLTLAAGLVAGLLLLRGTGCVAAALLSTPPAETFAFRKVAGEVCYEDGSLIPGSGVLVCFVEKTSRQSLGCTTAAAEDGRFATTLRIAVTGHGPQVVTVTLAAPAGAPLPVEIVAEEFASAASSPLTADVSKSWLELRVRKP